MLPKSNNWHLRPYQQEAVDAIVGSWGQEWEDGQVWASVCAQATGLGKTRVGLAVIQQFLQPGQRALWLAHRDILCQQALERARQAMPEVSVGLVKAENNEIHSQIVIGSVQTLCRANRMQELLAAGAFDLVVTDEAHHSPSDVYLRIYKWLRCANPDIVHVGLTATPWRGDGKWVMSDELFQAMPEKAQKNIRWGVKYGYLVGPSALQIETGVSLRNVKSRAGDFVVSELADVLDAAEWHKLVADAYEKHCWKEGEDGEEGRWLTALSFTPDVATSKRLVEEFQARGHNAVHIDGSTPLRDRRLVESGFRKREIQIVSNCAVYTEGADFPSAECVLFARPTQSHGLLTQAIGRGLRPYPGKEECLVLMFAACDAYLLTVFDLGKSKELAKAEEKAKELEVVEMGSAVPLFDDNRVDGVGVEARTVSLFGNAAAAWYRGTDGHYSVGLGVSDGWQRTLAILPPNGRENWALVGLAKKDAQGARWRIKEIGASTDVEDLMDVAQGVIKRRACAILTKKKKKWRNDPATAGQVKYLLALGAPLKAANALGRRSRGKGDAARLITHLIALKVLQVNGWVA